MITLWCVPRFYLISLCSFNLEIDTMRFVIWFVSSYTTPLQSVVSIQLVATPRSLSPHYMFLLPIVKVAICNDHENKPVQYSELPR
jgi:hypothetical protein